MVKEKTYTVFEAGYGGPHSVKHVVSATSSKQAKYKTYNQLRGSMSPSELFVVRGKGKRAEHKFLKRR